MKYFFFTLLILISNALSAQLSTYPLSHEGYQKTSSLIFFDDFASKTDQNPKASLWTTNGVLLNNTLAENAPTLYVATFDAYDKEGKAYDISSPLTVGFSDKLTSTKIDLSAIPAGSTDIYLSFYWQEQGLGETPDPEDYLVMKAKDKTGNWIELWKKEGSTSPSDAFTKENINIPDDFFHSDFQFEFERFGRNSGYYDVFHLDYVALYSGVLDQNDDTYFPDVAFQDRPQSFLKGFTAMPLVQYLTDPASFTNNTFNTTLSNLNNEPRVISNFQFVLFDTLSRTDLIAPIVPSAPASSPFMNPLEDFELEAKVTTPPTFSTDPVVVEARFMIGLAGDTQLYNDTIRSYASLQDYYAYDDGSAEYVAGIRQRFGKIAVAYEVPQEERLTDVDICFLPFEKDLSTQTFVLSVWKNIDQREEEVLFQKSYVVKYPDRPNDFVRFSMDEFVNVNVSGKIYVGIQQTTNDLLAIGFDKNNDAGAHIYQNTEGIWQQDSNIKGALMIRPVFSKDVVSAIPSKSNSQITLYPNPTRDWLHYKGVTITKAEIFDAQGRSYPCEIRNQKINVQSLPAGLYFLHAYTKDDHLLIQKWIKE